MRENIPMYTKDLIAHIAKEGSSSDEFKVKNH